MGPTEVNRVTISAFKKKKSSFSKKIVGCIASKVMLFYFALLKSLLIQIPAYSPNRIHISLLGFILRN